MSEYPLTMNDEQMSPSSYVAISVALGTIGVLGFVLNLLVVLIIIKDSQTLWTPVNAILLNLVVSDMLVAALGNPLALASAINRGWYWSHEMCIWYAWLMSTLGLASIGNLSVMAVERWLLVSRPMQAFSIRSSVLLSGGVWVYALCLSLPPVFGWGSYGPEAGNVSCSVSWEVHDAETMSDSYITFLFALGLILPVIIIGASYYAIIFTVKKVKRRSGSRGRREAKVTKMVALMIIAFLFAWTPYAGAAIAAQYFDTGLWWVNLAQMEFQTRLSPSFAVLPSLLAKSSICYNPIIYAGLNAQFPRSLKKLFGIRETNARSLDSQTTAMTVMKKSGET